MRFEVKRHAVRAGQQMVEVFDSRNRFIAAIYAHEAGLHVVSKFFDAALVEEPEGEPPGVLISLRL